MSVLGVVLILSSYFLLFGVYPGSLGPRVPWLVIPPALIILGISAFACFRKLPRWLLALNCGVSILGCLLQWLVYFANQLFACFDMCNPESTTIGYWLLLGLGGFLLSGLGAFVTLVGPQSRKA